LLSKDEARRIAVNIAKLPVLTLSEHLFSRLAVPDMSQPVTNERKYPHIVELAVGEKGLDVGLGRRIIDFHKTRHIKPHHGRIILRERGTFYRWCFSNLATAHAFMEQFGGEVTQPEPRNRSPAMRREGSR
jgi:hypothetical protein